MDLSISENDLSREPLDVGDDPRSVRIDGVLSTPTNLLQRRPEHLATFEREVLQLDELRSDRVDLRHRRVVIAARERRQLTNARLQLVELVQVTRQICRLRHCSCFRSF